MLLLRLLLPARRPLRLFALVDAGGRCRAFRQSAQTPVGAGWIEVNEQRLCWLQQPLPASARISQVGKATRAGEALAA